MPSWPRGGGGSWQTDYVRIAGDLAKIASSAYFSGLAQYGPISAPAILAPVVLLEDPPNPPAEDDFGTLFEILMLLGQIPSPGSGQYFYLVFLPPTHDDSAAVQPFDARGAHYAGAYSPLSGSMGIYWGWVRNSIGIEDIESAMTHELAEAITDPNGGDGVVLDPTSNGCTNEGTCEVGDTCNGCDVQACFADGTKAWVQSYWSARDDRCIAPVAFAPGQVWPHDKVTYNARSAGIPAITRFRGNTSWSWLTPTAPFGIGQVTLALDPDLPVVSPFVGLSGVSATTNGDQLVVAWTDPDGRVSVGRAADGLHFDGPPSTFDISAASHPAIAFFEGRYYLACSTGTKTELLVSSDGISFSYTGWPGTSPASGGPNLAVANGALFLLWQDTASMRGSQVTPTAPFVRVSAPVDLASGWYSPTLAGDGTYLYLAWTGGGAFIKLSSSSAGLSGFVESTTIGDQAVNSPAIFTDLDGRLAMAWTGLDSRLNVATIS